MTSTPYGNAMTPGSYDSSRVTKQIREGLRDLDPALRKGVLDVADAPPTPREGLVK